MRKGCVLLCLVFIQTVSSLESLITWLYLSYLNVRIKLKHQFFELSFILTAVLGSNKSDSIVINIGMLELLH